MSTSGKVLAILVTLMIPVWIVLMSLEAQLNVNWASKLHSETKAYDKAEADLAKQKQTVVKARNDAAQQLAETGREIVVLNNRLIDGQRAVSVNRETSSRLQNDIKRVDQTKELISKAREYRGQELEQTKTDLAKIIEDLDATKKKNTDLRGLLAKLQVTLQATISGNRELLEKAQQLQSKTVKPPATARAR